MAELIPYLPHVNACLNATATLLLVAGLLLIKRGRERAHQWTMISCFAVSVLFLACYVLHKYLRQVFEGDLNTEFPTEFGDVIRYTYYAILLTHVLLAMLVPLLAITTIWLGLRNRRAAHRRLARLTFPIWLYVSVTGVIVYLMIYQIFLPTV